MSVNIISIVDSQGGQACNGDEFTVDAGTITVVTDNASNAMTGRIFDFGGSPMGVTTSDAPPVGNGLLKWSGYSRLGTDQIMQIDDPDAPGCCVELTLNVITGPRSYVSLTDSDEVLRHARALTAVALAADQSKRDIVITAPVSGTASTTFTATGTAKFNGKPTVAALIGVAAKSDGSTAPVVQEFVSDKKGNWSQQFTVGTGAYDLFVFSRLSRAHSARVTFTTS